jgi:putative ABC transport system permease protein
LIIVLAVAISLRVFLRTKIGRSLNLAGKRETMFSALPANFSRTQILGLALSNAIVALSGGILAQHQNCVDMKAGIGVIAVGLASIIIGEAVFGRRNNLISAIFGAIAYRGLTSVVMRLGFPPGYFKLLSFLIVGFALLLPTLRSKMARRRYRKKYFL